VGAAFRARGFALIALTNRSFLKYGDRPVKTRPTTTSPASHLCVRNTPTHQRVTADMTVLNKQLLAALALILSITPAFAQSGSTGGATSRGSPSGGSPALGATPSGPFTPNRSNSEVFPPSRLAPRQPGIQDPSATMPSEQDGRGTQDFSGGRRVPSPATGGINNSTKTQKTPSDSIAECEKLWAPRTQMSKSDWTETCRRSENNLGRKQ
jgi:hypothetical protein